jgi:hypothetical protein
MRAPSRLLLATLAAAAVLAAGAATACASRLSVNEQSWRMVWQPAVMSIEGIATASCNITLDGSFHSRTFTKARAVMARSNLRFSGVSCTGTAVTLLPEALPWELVYDSFSGTLPSISQLNWLLRSVAFRIEDEFGGICLYWAQMRAPIPSSMRLGAGGTAGELVASTTSISRWTGPPACELLRAQFSGTARLTRFGTTTALAFTLI